MTNRPNDRFCSLKWTEVSWNLASNNIAACCTATPSKVDPNDILGGHLAKERQAMLAGEEVSACESCWIQERQGLLSKRLRRSTEIDTSNIVPKTLVLHLHSVCPLQCIYCCHEYSSSWFTDIKRNGPMLDQQRYQLSAKDRLRHSIGLTELSKSSGYPLFHQMLSDGTFRGVEDMRLSGGEPLHQPDYLVKILELAWLSNPDMTISINTGLSIHRSKLETLLDRLEPYRDRLQFILSMEATGRLAEIVRNGICWEDWTANHQLMRGRGFDTSFLSVLNLLTVFGFGSFLGYAHSMDMLDKVQHIWLTEPAFLDLTKFDAKLTHEALKGLRHSNLSNPQLKRDLANISPEQDEKALADFKQFMGRFASRKKIGADELPAPIRDLIAM